MRVIYFFIILTYFTSVKAQDSDNASLPNLKNRISTVDFVEIVNGNLEEAIYYYENNWKQLRKRALKNNYILSYQLLKAPVTKDSPIELLLITTYENQKQYQQSEANFRKLIESSGGLKLLNDKKPNEFRKVAFNKTNVKHLN